MLRKFIFKDTVTGEELVLPVTPKGYEIEHGRRINSLIMQESGEINLPGPRALLDMELECLFPAREYPFTLPGYGGNPWVPLEKLELWSDAGRVLRFIVSDTPVNAAVLLGPIRYREQDGTNDVYATLPVRGYRQLETTPMLGAASTTAATTARAVEGEPVRQGTYTVAAGDTLGAIARRFYGDASLAARVAAANGIKNVNLIYPGQVLKLPPKDQLPSASTGSTGAVSAKAASAEYKLKIIYTGASPYYGICRVDYAGGSSAVNRTKGETGLTAAAPVGTFMELHWSPQNGGDWDYIIVGGKTIVGRKPYYCLHLNQNTEVYIHWVKRRLANSE